MLRFFFIILPLVVAFVAVFIAAQLPLKQSDEHLLKEFAVNLLLLGVLCTCITWWREASLARQLNQLHDLTSSYSGGISPKEYQQKVRFLNAEISDLQSQLAGQHRSNQLRFGETSAVAKLQNSVLPKLYWTQEGGRPAIQSLWSAQHSGVSCDLRSPVSGYEG